MRFHSCLSSKNERRCCRNSESRNRCSKLPCKFELSLQISKLRGHAWHRLTVIIIVVIIYFGIFSFLYLMNNIYYFLRPVGSQNISLFRTKTAKKQYLIGLGIAMLTKNIKNVYTLLHEIFVTLLFREKGCENLLPRN